MVDSGDELAAGFPKTRDELFSYRGLILGSIEASAFTGDQLRMIADFADRRGGGLMMIGGRRAFAEGGYAGTPVADALPVVLESKQPGHDVAHAGDADPRRPVACRHADREDRAGIGEALGDAAVGHQRESDPAAEARRHGAAARHRRERDARSIALAYQRYGRGKTLAFPVYDSWTWQMDAEYRRRGHDARDLLAPVDAMAGRRRAGSRSS